MALNLQIPQPLDTGAQQVADRNGNISPLRLSTGRVGIGGTFDVSPFSVLEFGTGVSTLLFLRRDTSSEEGDPAMGVLFNLDPTNHIFNLDVGGQNNSQARIHLGDMAEPDNPVTTLGNVGIGTMNPEAKLDVRGDAKIEKSGSAKLSIRSRGNGTQHYSLRATNDNDAAGGRKFIIRNEDQSMDVLTINRDGNIDVSGDIRLVGADCAEDFDIVATANIELGTVMVVTQEGKLQQSSQAYDKKVVGVVSGAGNYRPGIVLGQQMDSPESRMPIALMGKVYCQVDADQAPIEVGDLLTTSPTPGHAMKALDPMKAFGAVIGKALGTLDAGKGLIPVLVALQ